MSVVADKKAGVKSPAQLRKEAIDHYASLPPRVLAERLVDALIKVGRLEKQVSDNNWKNDTTKWGG